MKAKLIVILFPLDVGSLRQVTPEVFWGAAHHPLDFSSRVDPLPPTKRFTKHETGWGKMRQMPSFSSESVLHLKMCASKESAKTSSDSVVESRTSGEKHATVKEVSLDGSSLIYLHTNTVNKMLQSYPPLISPPSLLKNLDVVNPFHGKSSCNAMSQRVSSCRRSGSPPTPCRCTPCPAPVTPVVPSPWRRSARFAVGRSVQSRGYRSDLPERAPRPRGRTCTSLGSEEAGRGWPKRRAGEPGKACKKW